MKSPGARPITVILYQGDKKHGAAIAALFGFAFVYSGYTGIQDDNLAMALLLGVPGLLLLAAAVSIFRAPSGTPAQQLIFDEEGFRLRMILMNGDRATPDIERAVATFRPDLWRADTPGSDTP
jgi:hypothetical protein